MIAAYVINLHERKDKLKHIIKEFENVTVVKPKLFPAIKHSNGSVGCLLSHQNIVSLAKQMKYDMVLVIEDDCTLCQDFNTRWPNIYKWLKDNKNKWEVFNGGMTHVDHKSVSCINMQIPIISAKGLRTQFIVYNANVYDKVIKLPSTQIIDKFTRNNCRMYTSIPFLSTQAAAKSDIKGYYRDNVAHFRNTELVIIRILKKQIIESLSELYPPVL